jgi:hypothetical protein
MDSLKWLFPLFVTMLAGGYMAGKYHSPDYRQDTMLREWVGRVNEKAGERFVPGLGGQDMYLAYPCDTKLYFYNVDLDTAQVLTKEQVQGPSAARPSNFLETLAFLAGGAKANIPTLGSSLMDVWRAAKTIPAKLIFTARAIVAAASGFAIGYHYAYEVLPDCKEGSVSKNLSDAAFWRVIADQRGGAERRAAEKEHLEDLREQVKAIGDKKGTRNQ